MSNFTKTHRKLQEHYNRQKKLDANGVVLSPAALGAMGHEREQLEKELTKWSSPWKSK